MNCNWLLVVILWLVVVSAGEENLPDQEIKLNASHNLFLVTT